MVEIENKWSDTRQISYMSTICKDVVTVNIANPIGHSSKVWFFRESLWSCERRLSWFAEIYIPYIFKCCSYILKNWCSMTHTWFLFKKSKLKSVPLFTKLKWFVCFKLRLISIYTEKQMCANGVFIKLPMFVIWYIRKVVLNKASRKTWTYVMHRCSQIVLGRLIDFDFII